MSYHNEDSLIVLDKAKQPPVIDLEGGTDLELNKPNSTKAKVGKNVISMFTKKRNEIAKVGTLQMRNDTVPQK